MNIDFSCLKQAHEKYVASRRTSNIHLWQLCVVAEQTIGSGHGVSQRASETLGVSRDTLEHWARVGWLIASLQDYYLLDEQGNRWTLGNIWEMDKLSFDHLLRAAQMMKRYEINPQNVLDNLYLALDGGQSAPALERELEVQEEDAGVLWKRDITRLADYLQKQSDLFDYSGASLKLQRARKLFLGRLRQESK